jgi:antitoxin component YwqK of YwqJK toxin-antitoxin module
MKKVSLILSAVVVIAILFIGCNEKRVPSDSLTNVKKTVLPSELTEIGGYKYYQGELFTGIAFYDDKDQDEFGHMEYEYQDGRMIEVRNYHLNGQRKKLSSFNANGDYTVFQEFNEEGQLKREVNFVDGKQVSETKY